MSLIRPFFKISKDVLKSLVWLIWTIRIVMLLGFIFVVVCLVSYITSSGVAPDSQEAPYSIVAITSDNLSRHVYYGETVLDRTTELVVVNYWVFDGKRYNYIKGEKALVKGDWGDIRIFRR